MTDRGRSTFLALADVSRETLADLDAYVALLEKWQGAFNLVGPRTLEELWSRHILDSVQVAKLLPPHARQIVDLGSGAGLPGLVLAIVLKHTAPEARVTLIESNGKKAAFLRIVVQSLSLPVQVISERIEAVIPRFGPVDVVTARALAALAQLFAWCDPLLKSGAVALFHKGRDLDNELCDASLSWDFSHDRIPSVVEAGSSILRVTRLQRKG